MKTTQTAEITQETLQEMFSSLRFLAGSRRSNNRAACDFYHLDEAEQVRFFNEQALPLWERMGRPEMFSAGWLEFQGAVFAK
jgi:hypothetical protein